jgi:hypothetical protein
MCHQPSDECMTHSVGTVQIYTDLTCTERIVIRDAAELRRCFVHARPSQCAWELLNVKKILDVGGSSGSPSAVLSLPLSVGGGA